MVGLQSQRGLNKVVTTKTPNIPIKIETNTTNEI